MKAEQDERAANVDSDWYRKDESLVGTLRESRRDRPAPPAIEGYDVLYELRRGGQGVVYVGTQQSTNRRVAIKVLSEDSQQSKSGRLRFEREIDLVANLAHANIVKVFDSGVTTDFKTKLLSERYFKELLRDRARIKAPR